MAIIEMRGIKRHYLVGEVRQSFKVIGGSGYWSTTVIGVEPDYVTIQQRTAKTGELFTDKDISARSKVALLGSTVAGKLFADIDPVGRRIRIQATPFTVIGVLTSKGSTGMGEDQDDIVLVPLDTALARLQKDRYLGAIEMSASRQDLMNAAQKEVEQIMRESHRLTTEEEADFDVMNQGEIIKTASQTTKTLTTLLAAIAAVPLLVGGIGIMNIMLVSVTERTRERHGSNLLRACRQSSSRGLLLLPRVLLPEWGSSSASIPPARRQISTPSTP